jgi:uncharacterized protein (TIGR00661 family)
MKILYAVQATGNGHISRAMELLPHMELYGKVDIFLSGDNSNLALNAPVKFRSKGLSLYYNCTGGLDYWQITKAFQLSRLKKEIKELPVEKYDLVINDFEYITAAACAKKKIPSVNFGHQASFQSSHTPRPAKKSMTGEWVLKNYAKASRYIGLHFKPYDNFIFPPIIKKEILEADPTDKNYITVYLPSWCEQQLYDTFKFLTHYRFQIFCRGFEHPRITGNMIFMPINKTLFDKSLIHCTGIITGGGFETPAEALHLQKKLMCIPIKGQYEQQCNVAALKEMGVITLKNIGEDFEDHFNRWIAAPITLQVNYRDSVQKSMDYLFNRQQSFVENKIAVTPSGLLSFLL